MRKIAVTLLVGAIFFGFTISSRADEGMWLLNNLPVKQLKDKYNFVPTSDWVESVQQSAGRLPNCSASFVSSDGLIMTNGHCAEESVQALSTANNNLYEKGFYAPTYAQELKTDRTLKVLMSTQDVTQLVENASDKTQTIQHIEKDMVGLAVSMREDETKYVCEVVVLYQGGQYNNYCYKVYDDIRLVFATEKNVWFMGGDADNFEYPRYAMDVAFFRAYQNDRPAKVSHYFKWSKSGAESGELIFVAGHPGSTKRLLTSEALKTERDVKAPFLMDLFRRREITLQQFMLRGKEQARIAKSDLFTWQNERKLYAGKIRGLQDLSLVASKEEFQNKVISDLSISPIASQKFKEGLSMVAEAQKSIREIYPKVLLMLAGQGFDSRLYDYAQSRLSDKQEAEAVLQARESEPPINLEYEEAKLRDSLTHLIEVMGADNPSVLRILADWGSPSELAHSLVNKTALSDINEHRKFVNATGAIVQQQILNDPMMTFAQLIKSQASQYRKPWIDAIEKERQGYAKISEVLFGLYGTDQYPDATFTLRLSFGTISGYEENGKQVAPFTTIGGAYKHSAEFRNSGDYKLPGRWFVKKPTVSLRTPLDFVSNLDITGGNSGSPVFNKNLEIVGIVFDSNIQGLVSDYDFKYAPNARAVAVHSSGILEILQKIYGANRLVKELTR